MRLCMDNIIFSLQRAGGISVYWSELWRRLLRDGASVTGIEAKNAGGNLFRNALHIPAEQLLLDTRPVQLGRYLSAHPVTGRYTLFHSSYYRTASVREMKCVQTVHDFTYERYWRGPARWIHSAQKRRALRSADGIICISENTQRDLLEFFPEIPKERTRIIHQGYSEVFQPLEQTSASQLIKAYVGFDLAFSVYVGDRSAYKNFKVAVDAVCQLSGHHLVIVGGGSLKDGERVYLQNRLPGRWVHVDKAPGPLLNAFYNRAHALIYPSSYEGFGIPVLEAMAAACPVIAVAASSIPEVAGDAGLLVPLPDADLVAAQLRGLADPVLRRTVIEAGSRQAQRFSWERCYKQTLDFYAEIQA